uniref:molecular chaperone MKKS-like n=1 Tax=Myxine glutinosa TaxID=7769 RepID=UPI00358E5710
MSQGGETKTPTFCNFSPLSSSSHQATLNKLCEVARSSYGPNGKIKLIHNGLGATTVASSASQVLLPALDRGDILSRFLLESAREHVQRCSDGGLFVLLFSVTLVQGCLHLAHESIIQLCQASRVNQHLVELCVEYLQSDCCRCRVQVDLSSLDQLLSLTRTVMMSKPACLLTSEEVETMTRLVVQAFLQTVPDSTNAGQGLGMTVLISVLGCGVEASRVRPGLLVNATTQVDQFASLQVANEFLVAVVSTSLAGDIIEGGDGVLHCEVPLGMDEEQAVLSMLFRFGEWLVAAGVRLVICQRVVHPLLMQVLQDEGIVVLHRLGLEVMDPLLRLTGARPIGSFFSEPESTTYGVLRSLEPLKIGCKDFLLLQPSRPVPVCTLVLCHRTDASLHELKIVCKVAEHLLQLVLKQPYALFGGGCTESHLATFVRHQMQEVVDDRLEELQCPRATYIKVAQNFASCLENVATSLKPDGLLHLVDNKIHHHWLVPASAPLESFWEIEGLQCACGLAVANSNLSWCTLGPTETERKFEGQALPATLPSPLLLDSFSARTNALLVAVEAARVILETKLIIEESH